ncbi:hypothetical protein CVIRNUC_008656 [Coccomyxa viridis]|uniref:Uncharacterized protein n=1 Tax=Coccomyxa viridis TaxID=1274662 RepID=A0AAV1IE38_9CHLO|nr:hypothetical protein CVIRNUC_008656 [Coccomyxa viridis]
MTGALPASSSSLLSEPPHSCNLTRQIARLSRRSGSQSRQLCTLQWPTRSPGSCRACLQPNDGSSRAAEFKLEAFSSDPDFSGRLPTQGEALVRGIGGDDDSRGVQLMDRSKPPADIDYLAELIAIQQNGPKELGFFGTRNMGFLHQNLIEILSYAMVLTDNHIYTSGATGTNAAVIRGALRAEKPDLLTVVLPQSRSRQPPESQELLEQVQNVIDMPANDKLSLFEASRLCNQDIVQRVQQVICFAFHDSRLLLQTCSEAKEQRKIVTLFYLD